MFDQQDITETEMLATIIAECMLSESVEEITVLDLYRMCANSHKYKDEDKLESTINIMCKILDGIASDRMRNTPGCDGFDDKRLSKENMFPDSQGE